MITLEQALLIGLVYFAANTSFLAGLGYFTTWRPLVNSLLVGLILGDPLQGVVIGGIINVLYLGYMSVGGTLGMGDAALAGILGATIGIAAPMTDPTQAIGFGVICGVILGNLGFTLLSLRLSLDNRIIARMDRAAADGMAHQVMWWNIGPAQALLFALTVPTAAALALITTYFTPLLVGIAPEWLLHGIGIAGTGAAGCLGIALAMRANARGWRLAAFMVGFLLTVFLGVPFAPLLAIGMASVGTYFLIRQVAQREVSLPLHAQRTFWLWQFFSHSSYSFSRLQGSGFACALAPALQRLSSASARAAALQRNLTFFNVEPNWGSLVVGVTLKQEEAHARGEIAAEVVTSTRQQLMGSISGFGDRVSQADLLPLILSIGLAISLGNSMISPLAGVLVYLALICPLMLSISYFSFRAGYLSGREAILSTLGSTLLQRWISIAQTAGVLMLGVLAALPSVTSVVPATSDNWFSPALSLILILVLYLLVHGTRLKPTWVLLLLLFVSAGLSAAGIL